MLSKWLKCSLQHPCNYNNFELIETQAIEEVNSEIKEYLNTALINARIKQEVLYKLGKKLGWQKVEEIIKQNLSPTLKSMSRGFFGEVFICKILEIFYEYTIPIQKWRYAISANQSLTGTDAIAIKHSSGAITEVCFIESKLRTTRNKTAAVEGYEQLKSDHSKEVPDMILFTLNRMEEQEHPIFPAFEEYLYKRRDLSSLERFYLGLVWEETVWTDETLDNLDASIIENGFPPLTVVKSNIRDLANLISEIYSKIGLGEPLNDE
jgi:hypothetical protein